MGVAWLLATTAWAGAQSDGGGAASEAEIVITGERVPRTIVQTPSSVEVVSEAELEALPLIADIDQLLLNIPNVHFGSGGLGPTIRGQDTTGVLRDLPAFVGGNRPRATIQVDGRPLNYFEFVFGTAPLWDVEQVEIFRTPQTTTQGRNSIAGAIFVENNDPGWTWESRMRLLLGNYDTSQLSAVLSGPLVDDQLAFRVSGDLFRQRTASDIGDNMRGADPDRDFYGLVRAKLLFEPEALEGLRLETSFVHLQSQAPQVEIVAEPFEQRADPFAGYGIFRVRTNSITGRLNWKVTPSLISSTTVSRGDSMIRRFAPPGRGESRTENDDFSQETLLRWEPRGPVQFSAGLNHLRATLGQRIDLTAVPSIRAVALFNDVQTSLGLFGEATIRPWRGVVATGGLRHQRDRQDREGQAGSLRLDFDRIFTAWLPKFSLAYEFDNRGSIGLLAQRAFNPGGVTINFFTAKADEFEPETLWNFETFARLSLPGGNLSMEANLFVNVIRDAQRVLVEEIVFPDGTRDFITAFANARRARSHGAEIQIDWRPTRLLRLSGGLGLLRTRILEADESTSLGPADRVEGKEFARAPRFTAFVSVEFRPVDPLSISAQIRHSSGYFGDDANYPELRAKGSTIIDSRLSWRAGPLTWFAYARNLFDRFYKTDLFPPDAAILGDPREYGAGIDLRF